MVLACHSSRHCTVFRSKEGDGARFMILSPWSVSRCWAHDLCFQKSMKVKKLAVTTRSPFLPCFLEALQGILRHRHYNTLRSTQETDPTCRRKPLRTKRPRSKGLCKARTGTIFPRPEQRVRSRLSRTNFLSIAIPKPVVLTLRPDRPPTCATRRTSGIGRIQVAHARHPLLQHEAFAARWSAPVEQRQETGKHPHSWRKPARVCSGTRGNGIPRVLFVLFFSISGGSV